MTYTPIHLRTYSGPDSRSVSDKELIADLHARILELEFFRREITQLLDQYILNQQK